MELRILVKFIIKLRKCYVPNMYLFLRECEGIVKNFVPENEQNRQNREVGVPGPPFTHIRNLRMTVGR